MRTSTNIEGIPGPLQVPIGYQPEPGHFFMIDELSEESIVRIMVYVKRKTVGRRVTDDDLLCLNRRRVWMYVTWDRQLRMRTSDPTAERIIHTGNALEVNMEYKCVWSILAATFGSDGLDPWSKNSRIRMV